MQAVLFKGNCLGSAILILSEQIPTNKTITTATIISGIFLKEIEKLNYIRKSKIHKKEKLTKHFKKRTELRGVTLSYVGLTIKL